MLSVVLVAWATLPAKSHALELGLTPSHVYSLWLNINKSLIAVSKSASPGTGLYRELAAMKPAGFDGKIPANVFRFLTVVKKKVAILRSFYAVESAEDLPQSIRDAAQKDRAEISPGHVFLESAHILMNLVYVLIDRTGGRMTYSQFFRRPKITGKTPSDVFGLVDLADRRLRRILTTIRAR